MYGTYALHSKDWFPADGATITWKLDASQPEPGQTIQLNVQGANYDYGIQLIFFGSDDGADLVFRANDSGMEGGANYTTYYNGPDNIDWANDTGVTVTATYDSTGYSVQWHDGVMADPMSISGDWSDQSGFDFGNATSGGNFKVVVWAQAGTAGEPTTLVLDRITVATATSSTPGTLIYGK